MEQSGLTAAPNRTGEDLNFASSRLRHPLPDARTSALAVMPNGIDMTAHRATAYAPLAVRQFIGAFENATP